MLRTVKKEDELLARGANPRTGLISPFVKIERQRKDYVSTVVDHTVRPSQVVKDDGQGQQQSGRMSSGGHWRANSASWGFVGAVVDVDPTKYDSLPSPENNCKVQEDLPDIRVEDFETGPTKMNERRTGIGNGQNPWSIGEGQSAMPKMAAVREAAADGATAVVQATMLKIPRKEVGSSSSQNQAPVSASIAASSEVLLAQAASKSSWKDKVPVSIRSIDKLQDSGVSHEFERASMVRQPVASMLKTSQSNDRIAPPILARECPSSSLSQTLPRLRFRHPSHFANF